MIDENTPVADHQSFLKYGATAEHDEVEEPRLINRVFICIALLGIQAQPCPDDRLS